MLYICIPTYNEAPTVGVLLWRIRKVFQAYSREYEVIVCDDGSTDATAETLAPYAEVLPLTVIGGKDHRGYAAALDALCRRANTASGKYARRDAILFLQADFTDSPEHIPELVKRFEGGADLVIAEREAAEAAPTPVRRLLRLAPWIMRPFLRVPGVRDPFTSFRLVRVAVVREMLKAAGDRPVVSGDGDGWTVNVDFLLRALEHTRRVETVTLPARYDLRPRESRVKVAASAMALFRYVRQARRRLPATAAT